jgi:hypothetical protein
MRTSISAVSLCKWTAPDLRTRNLGNKFNVRYRRDLESVEKIERSQKIKERGVSNIAVGL